jgi:hypothetical protein
MAGTKWESYKAQVEPMIQAIEDTFASDKGKKAIKQLAKTALSISKLSPKKPEGAPAPPSDQQSGAKPAADPIGDALKNLASGGGSEVQQQLAAIQKANPEEFKKAIDALGKA